MNVDRCYFLPAPSPVEAVLAPKVLAADVGRMLVETVGDIGEPTVPRVTALLGLMFRSQLGTVLSA